MRMADCIVSGCAQYKMRMLSCVYGSYGLLGCSEYLDTHYRKWYTLKLAVEKVVGTDKCLLPPAPFWICTSFKIIYILLFLHIFFCCYNVQNKDFSFTHSYIKQRIMGADYYITYQFYQMKLLPSSIFKQTYLEVVWPYKQWGIKLV